jgi:cytidylate kinase
MIITIDGPSGTGKSTVAKELAKRLKFTFFDTGAMYRAVTWCMMQENIPLDDENAIDDLLNRFDFRIEEANGKKRYFVDLNEVTEEIRTREVTARVSAVSAIGIVRKKVSGIQKRFALNANAVFEGRDMGSAVFPNADLKIFLTARPEIRAERRFKELTEKNPHCTYEEILRDILLRDEADSTRAISPLVKPIDAIEIDTSDFTVDEVVEKILPLVPQNPVKK